VSFARIAKFKIDANNNSPFAQYILGWMYEQGLYIEKDYDQALQWYISFPLSRKFFFQKVLQLRKYSI